jgi:hypothetical protein
MVHNLGRSIHILSLFEAVLRRRILLLGASISLLILCAACAGQPSLPSTTTPVPTSTAERDQAQVAPGSEKLIDLTRADLAGRLSVGSEQIKLITTTAVEWPDSALGCPQPGYSYLQVITPGFIIRYDVNGTVYEYHTDQTGVFVLCDQPSALDSCPRA